MVDSPRMDRWSRVLYLLGALQRPPGKQVADLALAMGTSGRTVQRELAGLREAGVAVSSSQAHDGRITMDGPTDGGDVILVLGREESLVVGTALAFVVAQHPGSGGGQAATALARVQRLLGVSGRAALRERLVRAGLLEDPLAGVWDGRRRAVHAENLLTRVMAVAGAVLDEGWVHWRGGASGARGTVPTELEARDGRWLMRSTVRGLDGVEEERVVDLEHVQDLRRPVHVDPFLGWAGADLQPVRR